MSERFAFRDQIFKTAHMWFDDKIVEADTTEDQSGVAMDKVILFFTS
jgi:hypothetical protein